MKMKWTMLVSLTIALYVLSACSRYEGYGVITWSRPDLRLAAGDVVPVVIRSNISSAYIIELPYGEEEARIAEVELWQLSFYSSMSAAEAAATDGRSFNYLYAFSKIDGLPIREGPDNTSMQVYRLRRSEMLKVTGKGEGAPVIGNDEAPIEGEWLSVMTTGGTHGWCFSYNLEIFDERRGIPAIPEEPL